MLESEKTVREILKSLPLQKRLQAIENIRLQKGLDYLNYVSITGLSGFFIFDKTRQGHIYWWRIKNLTE
jgi:hypothetical protein